jgi:hypothetical protein
VPVGTHEGGDVVVGDGHVAERERLEAVEQRGRGPTARRMRPSPHQSRVALSGTLQPKLSMRVSRRGSGTFPPIESGTRACGSAIVLHVGDLARAPLIFAMNRGGG